MNYEKLKQSIYKINDIYGSNFEVYRSEEFVLISDGYKVCCFIAEKEQFAINTMNSNFYELKTNLRDEILHLAWIYASQDIKNR
ncbi:hypothetical protein ETI08_03630 [Macrococcoides goetzii]|nr:hypothetical protein [Macrococcus goetzii]TDM48242.1 hypothetical protein ETI08_03630 [Macrococcus goetzii]